MSGITPVQNSQEVDANFTQNLQESASFPGRIIHKISDGGKYIIQSINNVAQSVLSKCIYVVSFGRYNLDSLKSYLFSNQAALKDNETAPSDNLPKRPAPPPPPTMPTQKQLNEASFRFSNAKVQEPLFQDSIVSGDLNSSSSVRQDFSQKDDNTLEGVTNSRPTSLHEGLEEQSNTNPSDISPQKKEKKGIQQKIDQGKQAVGNLFAGVKDSPLFKKMKDKVNQ